MKPDFSQEEIDYADELGDLWGDNVVNFPVTSASCEARDLIAHGLDLIPLLPKSKAAFEPAWADAPRHDAASFARAFRAGGNVGLRTGREIGGVYLHVADYDVDADAPEALAALHELFPAEALQTCPASVSGNASGNRRHYFFVTDAPLAKAVRKGAWGKVELLGLGQQVALPPSIHPNSGRPYRWLRPLDLDLADLGLPIAPHIPLARCRAWGARPAGAQPEPAPLSEDEQDEADLAEALAEARRDGRRASFEADLASGILVSALRAIPAEARDYETWRTVCMALHFASGGQADGKGLAVRWSLRSPWAVKHGEAASRRDLAREWRGWSRKDKTTGVGLGSVFKIAEDHGWKRPEKAKPAVEPSRLTFLTPDQCAAERARGYVVKGMFAPGDVGMIFGQPGAGKSLLAPYLGYMVARGESVFGMRTKPGKVFYVAAEDPHGMRGRVRALRAIHGEAHDFLLVDGVSDLLAPDSPDFAALQGAVEEQRPSLIFIDTLALAFPGLEENDAASMGHVVRVARDLAKHGAAVVLIHHPPKTGGTPRGHSLLNGALDVALSIERGEDGVIRGALTKNRNGSCARDIAFTIAVEDDGTDEDGDRITLPRAQPFDAGAVFRDLTKSERKALVVLETLIEKAQKTDPAAFGVPGEMWEDACISIGAVSGADKEADRRRAFRRARQELASKGRTTADKGLVRVNHINPNGLCENGQGGQRADKTECPPCHT